MKCELKEFIAHRHCIHVIEVKDNWSVQLTQRERWISPCEHCGKYKLW